MTDTNPFHSIIQLIEDVNSPLSFGRSGSQGQPYVYAFQLKLRNLSGSAEAIAEVVISSSDEKIIIKVDEKMVLHGKTVWSETTLVGVLPPVEGSTMENGLFFDDFQKRWGTFEIKVTLADGSYGSWVYPADEVHKLLEAGAASVAR